MPPTARSIAWLIEPVPTVCAEELVPVKTAVQVAEPITAGSRTSTTVAWLAKVGPAFVTTIV